MTFWASVPVLSVQTTEALATVSQEPRMRTRGFPAATRFIAKARASVTASGRPPGPAMTTKATEMNKIF